MIVTVSAIPFNKPFCPFRHLKWWKDKKADKNVKLRCSVVSVQGLTGLINGVWRQSVMGTRWQHYGWKVLKVLKEKRLAVKFVPQKWLIHVPGVRFQAGKEVCHITWPAKQMSRRLRRQRGTVQVEDSCLGYLLACEQFSGVNKVWYRGKLRTLLRARKRGRGGVRKDWSREAFV